MPQPTLKIAEKTAASQNPWKESPAPTAEKKNVLNPNESEIEPRVCLPMSRQMYLSSYRRPDEGEQKSHQNGPVLMDVELKKAPEGRPPPS